MGVVMVRMTFLVVYFEGKHLANIVGASDICQCAFIDLVLSKCFVYLISNDTKCLLCLASLYFLWWENIESMSVFVLPSFYQCASIVFVLLKSFVYLGSFVVFGENIWNLC